MNVEGSTIEAAQAAPPHPPRLPFVLSIGITGHRIEALPEDAVETIVERLGTALGELKARASARYDRERGGFADAPPRILVVPGSIVVSATTSVSASNEVALRLSTGNGQCSDWRLIDPPSMHSSS